MLAFSGFGRVRGVGLGWRFNRRLRLERLTQKIEMGPSILSQHQHEGIIALFWWFTVRTVNPPDSGQRLPVPDSLVSARKIAARIRASGASIYEPPRWHLDIYYSDAQLESLLNAELKGLDLSFPIRTRSKVLKTQVCRALGYPIPLTFNKTQPRFPSQNFDTYVQKANNLQIWNEEVSPARRYVLIRVDENDRVTKVKVVTGTVIASLDTTGTLTQKYQASSRKPVNSSILVSTEDTPPVQAAIVLPAAVVSGRMASAAARQLLPIGEVFERLAKLTGQRFKNPGLDQERNRGAVLHRLVQLALGDDEYSDSGQFPDVVSQLLEVKLQTSPTIDLGLVSPDGDEQLAINPALMHRDVRYAVFYASVVGADLTIDHVVVSAGADFFTFFRRFDGLVTNKKLQIPLPKTFFD